MVVYTFELGTWRHVQKDQRVEVSYIGKPCLKQASKQTKHVSVITASKSLHMKTKPRCLQLHQCINSQHQLVHQDEAYNLHSHP